MLITIQSLVEKVRCSIACIDSKTAFTNIKKHQGVLIDVREPDEYAKSAANGAINIPRGILEMKVLTLYPDPMQNIYIYCASGVRASLATEQLSRLGYKKCLCHYL